MNNSNTLLQFYNDSLKVFGLREGADGYLEIPTVSEEGGALPFLVNDKPVCLPSEGFLKNPDWERTVAFHPLSESSIRPIESAMIRHLRGVARYHLTEVLSVLVLRLLKIACDHNGGEKEQLNTKVIEMLSNFKKVDAKTLKFAEEVIKRTGIDNHQLVTVSVKKEGNIGDDKYARVCTIWFPILEALEAAEDNVWGVKPARKSDLMVLKDAIEILLPGANTTQFQFGSNSRPAPYFDAVLRGVAHAVSTLSRTAHKITKVLTNDERAICINNIRWMDTMPALADLRGVIPPLPENEGDTADTVNVPNTRQATTVEGTRSYGNTADVVQAKSQAQVPQEPQAPVAHPNPHPNEHGFPKHHMDADAVKIGPGLINKSLAIAPGAGRRRRDESGGGIAAPQAVIQQTVAPAQPVVQPVAPQNQNVAWGVQPSDVPHAPAKPGSAAMFRDDGSPNFVNNLAPVANNNGGWNNQGNQAAWGAPQANTGWNNQQPMWGNQNNAGWNNQNQGSFGWSGFGNGNQQNWNQRPSFRENVRNAFNSAGGFGWNNQGGWN